ncbi:unnamed protein product [Rhizoctonia solani]|nr:unnamed protein product [Rhizoctonia solani]
MGQPPNPNSNNPSDSESESDSDTEESPEQPSDYRPPTVAQAEEALKALEEALRTPLPSGGYKYTELDRVTAERCAAVKACLNQFLKAEPKGKGFIQASMDAARVQGRGAPYARTIRKWTRRLIRDGDLPGNPHRWWNVSILEDEDVSAAIKLRLQQVGKYACAQDVVEFLRNAELRNAVKIVEEHFPQFTHIFVYDNAPCHTKYSPSSLSAQGMPKGPVMDWPYYKNEKAERIFVRMEDGRLPDGSRQSFYDPDEPRRFKGMSWILRERGLFHLAEKNAPDFKSRDSTLQETARQLGTQVIFLPKYHCELTMIEQCWGFAKRDYRDNPPNSNPKVLKANALKAVNLVPILSMRKFGARAQRFVDGYHSGMNGSQAIGWATKVFRHHREPPNHIPYDEIAPGYVHMILDE